ncbi:hypothetical protein Bhyg_02361 [Pseudolycoriella hygida]|uniref:Uncharacterized protein n=1 Tax=Pseudolycoriella hygida TaxID=35572 RepID=A0A9Q0NB90_9DIPT|nr:hypothetical protein Bhyg_02361 [Pseudolycoriella hygida]
MWRSYNNYSNSHFKEKSVNVSAGLHCVQTNVINQTRHLSRLNRNICNGNKYRSGIQQLSSLLFYKRDRHGGIARLGKLYLDHEFMDETDNSRYDPKKEQRIRLKWISYYYIFHSYVMIHELMSTINEFDEFTCIRPCVNFHVLTDMVLDDAYGKRTYNISHPQKCMPNSPTCNKDLNAHHTMHLFKLNKPLS